MDPIGNITIVAIVGSTLSLLGFAGLAFFIHQAKPSTNSFDAATSLLTAFVGLCLVVASLGSLLVQYHDLEQSSIAAEELAAEQGYNAALERLQRGEPLGPTFRPLNQQQP